VYLTPTPEKYKAMRSRVAPLPADASPSAPVCARPADRGPRETRAQIEAALKACRKRTPRLPLASEDQARGVLPADWSGSGPLPQWVRLLADFPKGGRGWAAQTYHSETKGRLSPKFKAEIAYVAARNDRAWYALGHAIRRLKELGLDDNAIDALDQPGESNPKPERAALALARKVTVDPALITDADIEGLRKLYSDQEVAEIVYQITQAAFFDRLTEAAGLRLEPWDFETKPAHHSPAGLGSSTRPGPDSFKENRCARQWWRSPCCPRRPRHRRRPEPTGRRKCWLARDRLRALGLDDEATFAIDGSDEARFTPAERAACTFARKLTVDPALIDDDDFDALRTFYSDTQIAELIHHVNHDVFFNRVTGAARLPLDGIRTGSLSRRWTRPKERSPKFSTARYWDGQWSREWPRPGLSILDEAEVGDQPVLSDVNHRAGIGLFETWAGAT
jgi:alkylhydroperoxidase family enzyme